MLGLNAFHADAAAVLLCDGQVVGALAEERLSRVKHCGGFPTLALRRVLEMGGISIRDVEHIAVARDAKANLRRKLGFALRNLPRIGRLARQRLEQRSRLRDVAACVARACGVHPAEVKARLHFVEHHLCHAASAYFSSDFDRAAIATIDGFGDFASTALLVGEGNRLEVLERVHFPHSLGILYTAFCQFIGFDRYGDEGKVMGLAPYGEPRYRELLGDCLRLHEDGLFELGLDYFRHHRDGVDYQAEDGEPPRVAPLYSKSLEAKLGPPRRRGDALASRERDLARSLQERLEDAYVHVLNRLHRLTSSESLCLAGGVALNAVANGKVFETTPFRQLVVHPAATDDGTAFGAAYYVHCCELGKPRPEPLRNAYLGDEFSAQELAAALEARKLEALRIEDEQLYASVAEALAEGKIVGWYQGRMEWGPRALGHRSILAHPGRPGMKDRLNARVKHRESFRPFAPSILEERTGDYFSATQPSPFMTQVYTTRPERREELCAVDHVDHTARLQTVARDSAPRFHALLRAFEERTGIPLLLNTSFNENEPIVRTPEEAIDCYLRTGMDLLVLGNFVVRKPA